LDCKAEKKITHCGKLEAKIPQRNEKSISKANECRVESGEREISSIFIVQLYLLGLWPGNFLKYIEMKQKNEAREIK
jgi:hypothetical protein